MALFAPDPRQPSDSDTSTQEEARQASPADAVDAAAVAVAAKAAEGMDTQNIAWRKRVVFYVNGRRVAADDVQPHHTLLHYLRERLGLTGTKLGCGEGGCGACTVTVAHYDQAKGTIVHRAVNACLAPVCSVDGCAVTTTEGIGTAKRPHPVQERIAEAHGSQCGFCTPGIVMSLYSTLCRKSEPSLAEIEASFDGNLCRCTGYRPILDAAKTFAGDRHNCAPAPCGYGQAGAKAEDEKDVLVCSSTSTVLSKCGKTGPVPSAPFPEALRGAGPQAPLRLEGSRVTWYCPTDLASLLALKTAHPDAKLIGGNTEVGIETKFKHLDYPVMVSTASVQDLHVLRFDAHGALLIGGAVTLSALEHFLEESLLHGLSGFQAMLEMLRWFASTQIRNVAALAGNLATASPISDMNPVLMALGATVLLASAGAKPREVSVRDFFKGYRKVDMAKQEVVCSIRVPPTRGPYEFAQSFKQAKRRDDDISIVNACLRVRFAPVDGAWRVEEFHAAFGGMAPTTSRARRLERALKGRVWSAAALDGPDGGYAALAEDLPLPENVPGGMPAYRQTLAASFVFKFFVSCALELDRQRSVEPSLPAAPRIEDAQASASQTFLSSERPVSTGSQRYHVPSGGLQKTEVAGGKDHAADGDGGTARAPVGQPLRHAAALAQCTGEAQYVDDLPSQRETLHAALVLSERPHARIVAVDAALALEMPGVEGFFSAKDLTEEQNKWGPVLYDEQLFRRDTVTSTGQPLGIVVAATREEAQDAARMVKVEYEDLSKPVLTIEDAIAAESWLGGPLTMEDGDVEEAFAAPDTVAVEGEIRLGGQEHFYLETCSVLVEPSELDELVVYTSTQTPMKTQKFAAKACGLPCSKVVCRMKRMGGGFGGKETRTVFISSAAAVAAHRLQRPVRLNLDRDVDMWVTGTRHPFIAKYRAGAGPDGRLRALDLKIYCNAGFSLDLSEPVLGRAIFHCDNTYKIPNVRVLGRMCFTNTTSNTAFRGFGGPQGLISAEAWMDHLAAALKMDPEKLRGMNLYGPNGDRTHFYQVLHRCPVQRMWSELVQSSELQQRQAGIAKFNQENRWRKRGIALLPTKFGISFTAKFMNQAGALVHIYTDGTVLVTHGGTEMGQGLHTKMVQVTARALGIPCSDVHIRETSTETVPNSSPTAASASSDLYGMAILNACEQLKERMKPYMEKAGGDFKKAAFSAFFDRTDLSAHGFYKTPGIGYDWTKPTPDRGTPFNYFTYGAAASEVEIDVLTGDMRILRADILMDLGNSLNPAIDVGQIEGAFTQGVGWTMIEETMWGCSEHTWIKPGHCHTRGPGTYKIPAFNDVPIDMRVTLLKNSPNEKAIHSSRAVGEPPFFLGASAFFAARRAVAAARKDAGLSGHFTVDCPLTAERIRMACGDRIAEGFAGKLSRPRPSGFW